MTILSLDLASVTGYAVIEDGVIIESGEIEFKMLKDIERPHARRLRKFLDFLNDQNAKHKLTEIFFEQIDFIVNRDHAYGQFGFEAILELWSDMADVRLTTLTPGEWKKNLTGWARKGKGQEKFRMCAKLHSMGWKGGKIDTDKANNECDAIGLAFAIHRIRSKELVFKA